jgi:hypothetical protein
VLCWIVFAESIFLQDSVGVPAEKPKTVQIDESAHRVLAAAMGSSREIKGSLSNAIRWIVGLDPDIRSVVFDGVSPEAEVRILELILIRAKDRAATSVRDVAGKIGTPPLKNAASNQSNLGSGTRTVAPDPDKPTRRERHIIP